MPFDWGSGAKGAATGAALGSVIPGIGTLLGGGLGFLGGSIFGGGSDPSKRANKYLDQIPDQLKEYLMPYVNAGTAAIPELTDLAGEYKNMYQNPNEIISRLGAGYQRSPGYDWQLQQGQNAINNAAAVGGMAGTAQHQQQAGELATHLANQDYQRYLQQVLGLYGGGLEGQRELEENLFRTGAATSNDLATSLANILASKAGLKYQGQAAQNKGMSDLLGNILSYLTKK